MSRRALRRARVVRGLLVALCGSMLAVGGHLLAGGAVPRQPALFGLIALAAGATVVASDRAWSYRRLLAALAAIEAVTHVALELGHQHAALTAGPAPAGSLTAATLPGSVVTGSSSSGWLMLAAHAAAALATAWLLRRGEALFWRAVEALRPATSWPTVGAPAAVPRPLSPRADSPVQPVPVMLSGAASHRGPPPVVRPARVRPCDVASRVEPRRKPTSSCLCHAAFPASTELAATGARAVPVPSC